MIIRALLILSASSLASISYVLEASSAACFNDNNNYSSRHNNNKCEKSEALQLLSLVGASVLITNDDKLHQLPLYE